jgi:hypothetical protein
MGLHRLKKYIDLRGIMVGYSLRFASSSGGEGGGGGVINAD